MATPPAHRGIPSPHADRGVRPLDGVVMTQHFISEHGDSLAGAVLSGSNGAPPRTARVGLWLAALERLRVGPRGKSPLLKALVFGAFNKPFKPARTPFAWLSRDP